MMLVQKKCVNRKLNLVNFFLGINCACLIGRWIERHEIDVSKVILRQNSIGDAGVAKIASAIRNCISILQLDLTSNGLTAKCAKTIYSMLADN